MKKEIGVTKSCTVVDGKQNWTNKIMKAEKEISNNSIII